ncbi:unnamed protein product [Mycena citricolor]|uniref:MICOS complex subunit MIC60 n=2 Tax=Mycena citricolor TaxID=2018698 RepID=A0AAD2Q2S6_9AGAR|nr:unnamed protein product [Mycena citricolor]
MYRTLPTRRLGSGGAVRVVRRRLATEAAPTPAAPAPKKRHIVRNLFLTSTGLVGTFYLASPFLAFKNEIYYEFFTDNVPLGHAVMDYAESNHWNKATPESVLADVQKMLEDAQRFVTDKINGTTASGTVQDTKAVARNTKEAALRIVQESKDRANAAAARIKTEVKKDVAETSAVVKHQSEQFTREIRELVRDAENALTQGVEVAALATESDVSAPPPASRDTAPDVYDAPLPVGFELPHGYRRPPPPPAPKEPEPAMEPLPRLTPALVSITGSEPIVAHLAGTIDNLTAFVEANPASAAQAAPVIDAAKADLTALVERIEKVRETERTELEGKLDDQTREYTVKLLELEMEAQDKLDGQEQDFRRFFDEERAKLIDAYRLKLELELETQTELINERLKEEVVAQGIELQRRWIREVKVHVEQERGGRLAKIEELATNLKKLERIALDNSVYLDENLRIHALWSALRALTASAISSPVRKPFREELRIVRHISAARDDEVVAAALESLEASDVPDVGVEPFADLATWFAREVAPKVAHVALVPEQDAGLLSHLASRAFAALQFRRQGLVAGDDVLSVLARAEYHLNEKDLDSAARELNQLKGTAKLLLADWLDAARKRLEVEQALEVVQAQATLASLLVV